MPASKKDDHVGGSAMEASGIAAIVNPGGAGHGGDELPEEIDRFGSITQSTPLDRKASGNNISIVIGSIAGALIGLMPTAMGNNQITFAVALVITVAVAWCSRFRALITAALVATAVLSANLMGSLSSIAVLWGDQTGDLASVMLMVSIWAVVGVRAVEGRLKAKERSSLLGLVRKDFLTGVGNQRAFWEALVGLIALSRRSGTPLSLVLLDMDNFKDVNDSYGHQSGDLVLKAVAHILRRTCREADQLFRYGGDEFAVICPDTTESGAEGLSRRLLEAISKLPAGFPSISACIGVAQLKDGYSASSLLDVADNALMKVKKEGRFGNIGLAGTGATGFGITTESSEFNAQQAALQLAMASLSPDREVDTGHAESVERLIVLVAERLGAQGEECEKIRLAARVHDVGTYVIPDSVREKPGPLNENEWKLVRAHVEAGESIVRSIPQLEPTAQIVRHTHERWDGNGYPDSVEGEAIPLGSRIIAVCDCFQALRHDRSYRKSLTTNEALDELMLCSGTQFDPSVVDALVEVVSNSRPHGGNVSLSAGEAA